MQIWKDKGGKWMKDGYQPDGDKLDTSNPPRGGSGVEPKYCEPSNHVWKQGYYGWECAKCGLMIPFGCEPWLPFDEEQS